VFIHQFKFKGGVPLFAHRFSFKFEAYLINGSSIFLKRIDEPKIITKRDSSNIAFLNKAMKDYAEMKDPSYLDKIIGEIKRFAETQIINSETPIMKESLNDRMLNVLHTIIKPVEKNLQVSDKLIREVTANNLALYDKQIDIHEENMLSKTIKIYKYEEKILNPEINIILPVYSLLNLDKVLVAKKFKGLELNSIIEGQKSNDRYLDTTRDKDEAKKIAVINFWKGLNTELQIRLNTNVVVETADKVIHRDRKLFLDKLLIIKKHIPVVIGFVEESIIKNPPKGLIKDATDVKVLLNKPINKDAKASNLIDIDNYLDSPQKSSKGKPIKVEEQYRNMTTGVEEKININSSRQIKGFNDEITYGNTKPKSLWTGYEKKVYIQNARNLIKGISESNVIRKAVKNLSRTHNKEILMQESTWLQKPVMFELDIMVSERFLGTLYSQVGLSNETMSLSESHKNIYTDREGKRLSESFVSIGYGDKQFNLSITADLLFKDKERNLSKSEFSKSVGKNEEIFLSDTDGKSVAKNENVGLNKTFSDINTDNNGAGLEITGKDIVNENNMSSLETQPKSSKVDIVTNSLSKQETDIYELLIGRKVFKGDNDITKGLDISGLMKFANDIDKDEELYLNSFASDGYHSNESVSLSIGYKNITAGEETKSASKLGKESNFRRDVINGTTFSKDISLDDSDMGLLKFSIEVTKDETLYSIIKEYDVMSVMEEPSLLEKQLIADYEASRVKDVSKSASNQIMKQNSDMAYKESIDRIDKEESVLLSKREKESVKNYSNISALVKKPILTDIRRDGFSLNEPSSKEIVLSENLHMNKLFSEVIMKEFLETFLEKTGKVSRLFINDRSMGTLYKDVNLSKDIFGLIKDANNSNLFEGLLGIAKVPNDEIGKNQLIWMSKGSPDIHKAVIPKYIAKGSNGIFLPLDNIQVDKQEDSGYMNREVSLSSTTKAIMAEKLQKNLGTGVRLVSQDNSPSSLKASMSGITIEELERNMFKSYKEISEQPVIHSGEKSAPQIGLDASAKFVSGYIDEMLKGTDVFLSNYQKAIDMNTYTNLEKPVLAEIYIEHVNKMMDALYKNVDSGLSMRLLGKTSRQLDTRESLYLKGNDKEVDKNLSLDISKLVETGSSSTESHMLSQVIGKIRKSAVSSLVKGQKKMDNGFSNHNLIIDTILMAMDNNTLNLVVNKEMGENSYEFNLGKIVDSATNMYGKGYLSKEANEVSRILNNKGLEKDSNETTVFKLFRNLGKSVNDVMIESISKGLSKEISDIMATPVTIGLSKKDKSVSVKIIDKSLDKENRSGFLSDDSIALDKEISGLDLTVIPVYLKTDTSKIIVNEPVKGLSKNVLGVTFSGKSIEKAFKDMAIENIILNLKTDLSNIILYNTERNLGVQDKGIISINPERLDKLSESITIDVTKNLKKHLKDVSIELLKGLDKGSVKDIFEIATRGLVKDEVEKIFKTNDLYLEKDSKSLLEVGVSKLERYRKGIHVSELNYLYKDSDSLILHNRISMDVHSKSISSQLSRKLERGTSEVSLSNNSAFFEKDTNEIAILLDRNLEIFNNKGIDIKVNHLLDKYQREVTILEETRFLSKGLGYLGKTDLKITLEHLSARGLNKNEYTWLERDDVKGIFSVLNDRVITKYPTKEMGILQEPIYIEKTHSREAFNIDLISFVERYVSNEISIKEQSRMLNKSVTKEISYNHNEKSLSKMSVIKEIFIRNFNIFMNKEVSHTMSVNSENIFMNKEVSKEIYGVTERLALTKDNIFEIFTSSNLRLEEDLDFKPITYSNNIQLLSKTADFKLIDIDVSKMLESTVDVKDIDIDDMTRFLDIVVTRDIGISDGDKFLGKVEGFKLIGKEKGHSLLSKDSDVKDIYIEGNLTYLEKAVSKNIYTIGSAMLSKEDLDIIFDSSESILIEKFGDKELLMTNIITNLIKSVSDEIFIEDVEYLDKFVSNEISISEVARMLNKAVSKNIYYQTNRMLDKSGMKKIFVSVADMLNKIDIADITIDSSHYLNKSDSKKIGIEIATTLKRSSLEDISIVRQQMLDKGDVEKIHLDDLHFLDAEPDGINVTEESRLSSSDKELKVEQVSALSGFGKGITVEQISALNGFGKGVVIEQVSALNSFDKNLTVEEEFLLSTIIKTVNIEGDKILSPDGAKLINVDNLELLTKEPLSGISIEGGKGLDEYGENEINIDEGKNLNEFGNTDIDVERGKGLEEYGENEINIDEGKNLNEFGNTDISIEEGKGLDEYGDKAINVEEGKGLDEYGDKAINVDEGKNLDEFGNTDIDIEEGKGLDEYGDKAINVDEGRNLGKFDNTNIDIKEGIGLDEYGENEINVEEGRNLGKFSDTDIDIESNKNLGKYDSTDIDVEKAKNLSDYGDTDISIEEAISLGEYGDNKINVGEGKNLGKFGNAEIGIEESNSLGEYGENEINVEEGRNLGKFGNTEIGIDKERSLGEYGDTEINVDEGKNLGKFDNTEISIEKSSMLSKSDLSKISISVSEMLDEYGDTNIGIDRNMMLDKVDTNKITIQVSIGLGKLDMKEIAIEQLSPFLEKFVGNEINIDRPNFLNKIQISEIFVNVSEMLSKDGDKEVIIDRNVFLDSDDTNLISINNPNYLNNPSIFNISIKEELFLSKDSLKKISVDVNRFLDSDELRDIAVSDSVSLDKIDLNEISIDEGNIMLIPDNMRKIRIDDVKEMLDKVVTKDINIDEISLLVRDAITRINIDDFEMLDRVDFTNISIDNPNMLSHDEVTDISVVEPDFLGKMKLTEISIDELNELERMSLKDIFVDESNMLDKISLKGISIDEFNMLSRLDFKDINMDTTSFLDKIITKQIDLDALKFLGRPNVRDISIDEIQMGSLINPRRISVDSSIMLSDIGYKLINLQSNILLGKDFDKKISKVDPNSWLEILERWWFIRPTEPKDRISIPSIDYPYETQPVMGLEQHPVQEFKGMGTEDIWVSIEIIVELTNIVMHWWHHSYNELFRGMGDEVLQGMMRVLFSWFNLDYSKKQMEEKGATEEYKRVFRWIRWEVEKVFFLYKEDLKNNKLYHGNHYMEILVENLLSYIEFHHYMIVPLSGNLNRMDSMRNILGTDSDPQGDIMINPPDKVKGDRDYIIDGEKLNYLL
jgi:hypothetical protein